MTSLLFSLEFLFCAFSLDDRTDRNGMEWIFQLIKSLLSKFVVVVVVLVDFDIILLFSLSLSLYNKLVLLYQILMVSFFYMLLLSFFISLHICKLHYQILIFFLVFLFLYFNFFFVVVSHIIYIINYNKFINFILGGGGDG